MPFITVEDELVKKSVTDVGNKFITRYLPELDAMAVKVYLFALYICQNGQNYYTFGDFAKKLNMDEEQLAKYFEYLDEFELIAITSYTPFEIKILDIDNLSGKPKRLHPEKYEGLYEEIQALIAGRMVSQNEFRDYLVLLEDYSFERNALVMIISYCVNLKGDKISPAYIKKVATSFEQEGCTTVAKVEEKLSSYTNATSALIRLFAVMGIKRQPAVEDGELYNKWTGLGFSDDALLCTAKIFKAKSPEKLDRTVLELYKNKKFDPVEIDDYRKSRDSLYNATYRIARCLGVYMEDPSPYVENYTVKWYSYGFDAETLEKIATYCFLNGHNSFEKTDEFISKLYEDGVVDDDSVADLLERLAEDDKFVRRIFSACGLTRKIIPHDRQLLSLWRGWGFGDDMILAAAQRATSAGNPVAYMNNILSSWKNSGIFSVGLIPETKKSAEPKKRSVLDKWRSTIEKYSTDDDEEN